MPQLISSVAELKTLCNEEQIDCFIALNYGIRSTKTIEYVESLDVFRINNHIDDSLQVLKPGVQLERHTNIPEAIEKKAFYLDD